MDNDLIFIIGIVVLVMAFPAIVGALTESRAPRTAAILVMIGGGLVGLATYRSPGTYQIDKIDDAVVRVVNHYVG